MRAIYKIALVITLLCCLHIAVVGQDKHAVFNIYKHDLGKFSEDDQPKSFDFEFTNTGATPMVITRAGTSCGCTVPSFPRSPIMAGSNGKITVTYHPKGHPGSFNRNVFIFTNRSDKPIQLSISGSVTPTTDQYANYPYNVGGLRLKRMNVDFKDIQNGKQRIERTAIVNGSNRSITLTFTGQTESINCYTEPATLEPGELGDLVIIYKPDSNLQPGIHKDEIYLEGVSPRTPPSQRVINIKANIK